MNAFAPQRTHAVVNGTQNLFTVSAYIYGIIMSGNGAGIMTLQIRTDPSSDADLAGSWTTVYIGGFALGDTEISIAQPFLVDGGLRVVTTVETEITVFHTHLAT